MAAMSGEDKTLKRVREICLKIPDMTETSSWGHANWRVGKKLFAAFDEFKGRKTLSFFTGVAGQDDLLADRRFALSPYTDHHGWLCLQLDRDTDWTEVRALIVRSHALVTAAAAPKGGATA
ncbi:MAG TPA: hypothetical protein DCZ01_02950 [Elusimicrobia bacterium]|nr:MAG: hypothetical protein A2X37_05585 [Elusimicrobia bacterium GWA2_66_18]OGR75683.1 MAG: hypothetical protein A2X40_00560 [Elusimicrobia bacterium GWC2_65_9]HAZ07489.1 hypothetical protein [Elusimicrobiota bacterium]